MKRIYTTYDRVAQACVGPMFTEHRDESAIRIFSDAIQNDGNFVNQHPNDYEIRRIGTFNETTGEITPEHPETIVTGAQVLAKLEQDRQAAERKKTEGTQTELHLTS